MKTPNYKTTEAFSFTPAGRLASPITLPAGSFVRPITPAYVPKHVLENPSWEFFNPEKEAFVYCRYGIIVVPKHILREV